jgi:hypothetical protein
MPSDFFHSRGGPGHCSLDDLLRTPHAFLNFRSRMWISDWYPQSGEVAAEVLCVAANLNGVKTINLSVDRIPSELIIHLAS